MLPCILELLCSQLNSVSSLFCVTNPGMDEFTSGIYMLECHCFCIDGQYYVKHGPGIFPMVRTLYQWGTTQHRPSICPRVILLYHWDAIHHGLSICLRVTLLYHSGTTQHRASICLRFILLYHRSTTHQRLSTDCVCLRAIRLYHWGTTQHKISAAGWYSITVVPLTTAQVSVPGTYSSITELPQKELPISNFNCCLSISNPNLYRQPSMVYSGMAWFVISNSQLHINAHKLNSIFLQKHWKPGVLLRTAGH